MGDSYREELRRQKTRSGFSQARERTPRQEAEARAKVRAEYLRKSRAGRDAATAAAARRLL